MNDQPYYRRDLAAVHQLGFGDHADAYAPAIVGLLEPVLTTQGSVVEIGCGSGALTRHLTDAGHHVVATDASPAMIDLARVHAPGAVSHEVLRLPDDPVPPAAAIVSVGHVLAYLPHEAAIDAALVAIAAALEPGGILVTDLLDLSYGATRTNVPASARVTDEWTIVTSYRAPSPARFVRDITVFTLNADGSWRRDIESHVNVLVDTTLIVGRLRELGIDAGVDDLRTAPPPPAGMHLIVGHKRA